MTGTNHPTAVEPYLFFEGRCDEALEFYRHALGAKIAYRVRFKDSPDPTSTMPGVDPEKIMHASFRVGEQLILASDGRCGGSPKFEGFALTFTVATEAAADRAFAALSEGGQVQMPLAKTFFSPRFGMVSDRFGVAWMIMVQPAVRPFKFSRTFNAPRAKVWQAWTDREELLRWFGPRGFAMTAAKLDLRPGGSFHYCLQGPDGKSMWGKFGYRVIEAPERIVLVSAFSDEKGGLTRHPFAATWPLEMLSTTTLAEENGKTILTIESMPLNPTEAERRTFEGAHDGMMQGWTGTFDQLAEHLAKG
ncbi:MAG: SRPBCC domain-containing protein [Verrucomicrobiota bacterium]